jgi:hypothetical protein
MAVGKAASGKVEDITQAILVLRGRRVLLDAELAVLYGRGGSTSRYAVIASASQTTFYSS